MSRTLFSNSVPRVIFDVAREIRKLTGPHQPSASGSRSSSPLHLPDVWTPSQYLINMGFKPAFARRLSSVYMDIVARYRQTFKSYFRRAIQGSCHLHLGHYHDIFVIQFQGTIQVLESQFMLVAWDWLRRAGLLPTLFLPQCIDVRAPVYTTLYEVDMPLVKVRVDAVTKDEILSRLGLKTTSFIMDAVRFNYITFSEPPPDFQLPHLNQISNRIEPPEEKCKTEGDFSTKMVRDSLVLWAPISFLAKLPTSAPTPLRSTTSLTGDLFCSERPSTCFPACYPPPLSKSISSPQETLVTQLKLTPPARNDKQVSNRSVDVSSLLALFGKMSLTTSEAGLKTQENHKCTWTFRSKKPEPSPLPTSLAASTSGLPSKPQSPNKEVASSAKPVTKPRKRRIAALPKRHVQTTALPNIGPSLPPTANPPVSRTPSLVSDTSSCADSFSSSDELDTPPSTPPSHSHVLIACNTLSTGTISSKSNTTGSYRLPMLTGAIFPDQRKGEGIHIDFTNGEAAREQQFSFTFGA